MIQFQNGTVIKIRFKRKMPNRFGSGELHLPTELLNIFQQQWKNKMNKKKSKNKQILNSIDFIYLSLLSRRIDVDDFIQEKTRLANNAKMKIHFFRSTECIIALNFWLCFGLQLLKSVCEQNPI